MCNRTIPRREKVTKRQIKTVIGNEMQESTASLTGRQHTQSLFALGVLVAVRPICVGKD